MYKYCLFDLDGTLTDPKEGICKSAQYGLHKMGIEEADIDKLEPFIGPPLIDSYMEFYNMSKEDAAKAVEYYRERFSVVGLYENQIYPGIEDMLKNLKAHNVKIAIASSKPTVFVEKILEHFSIKKYFDAIVGSELDGTRVQKSEVINEALAQLLGMKNTGKMLDIDDEIRKSIVMIGDRKFDIEGAKSFSVDSIGVSYGYAAKGELKKAGATYIATTVNDVEKYILAEKKTKNQNAQIKEQPVPEKSFFRAVYAIVPFALYFCIMQAVLAVFLIIRITINRYGSIDAQKFINGGSWVISGGVTGLSILVAGIMMYVIYHKTDRLVIKAQKSLVPIAILGMLLAVGLNLFFGFVGMWFPKMSVDTSASIKNIPVVIGFIISVIISPLSEELLFRYMLYGRVRRFMTPVMAAVLSAIFFGLYHTNILQGIYAFIMGYVMARLYEWTKNFMAPFIFHLSANLIIFSAMQLKAGENVALTVIVCVGTVIGGTMLFMTLKNKLAGK